MTGQKGEDLGSGPLKGLRVLDITSVLMGPYATQTLGDLGADVIMIEPLGGGTNRRMGVGAPAKFSWLSLNLLRNKRCVGLDIRDAAARDATLQIAAGCDVLVTNFRTEAMERLGLGYKDVRQVNPNIIYCQANGFRSDSGRAADPAYDDIIQAASGYADSVRRVDGAPGLAPMALADKLCSTSIVTAVLAALVHRDQTGSGQKIEVPMLDVMRAFVLVENGGRAISEFGEEAGYNRVLSPSRGPQQAKDGWVMIMPYSERAFDLLFEAGGRPDLLGDPRSRDGAFIPNSDFLYAELASAIGTKTVREWLAFCNQNDIPIGEVASLEQLVEELPIEHHPEAGPYRTIPNPLIFSESPVGNLRHVRSPGQDTVAVLTEAGVGSTDIGDLIERKVAHQFSGEARR